ncbi:indolepyruvate ferredoxin oxidoreductase family protein [Bosea sp. (in: a-proteobacteria)]|jgi:indolepyruvate ferredoxin oxidoreductase|uniref:indolepyruvate ferredoxin oxidoreductase family protein n=1 Tax=Bosea sp. (in: a-proteobacteria) TaxID=1871050 RepID=UPI002DDDA306|nr:indolepyruvate ferredoxin oxidoreductase family protein [Bosea sp. (in: a-proteobacteria)]HEV2508493.1 indolepyruvate ferredoxin oxidoreductase family protein [Bosea sp. (in: a-proteobacteria)]
MAGTQQTSQGAAADEPELRTVALDDKYDLSKQQIFLTGTQAIARTLLVQHERDRRAGLNTAGFVSGYRGSPLGGLDQQLARAGKQLKPANIVFQPGLNEDLAATAIWGTQQAELSGEGKYDGVFALWYGKGPGVDRTGDVFRHGNMAGTSRHGGVLCLLGDDHTAESSTNAHQTEFVLVDRMMPILNPAGVQEIMDYSLHGFALSRFAGVWVGLKCVKDNIESTASVDGSVDRVSIATPDDFVMPPGGLNIRRELDFLDQEKRLHLHKRAAILAYLRANKLNQTVLSGGQTPRIGIITVGKSYLDVRQALEELGLDEVRANDLGIRLFKIACPWPLDPQELKDFAAGLDLVMVVEEKRSLIEVQLREELYGTAHQPMVIGKKDEQGEWLFPVHGALDPNDIAIALGARLLQYRDDPALRARLEEIAAAQGRLAEAIEVAKRTPYFCSGCPHNSSTVVPEGSRAYAGIGCHYMVQWMDRDTAGFTQMGGEGANWVGEAPFSKRGHVFQNLGDGTYTHSGSLAIRWAVASGVNITYKLLYNDAVAMTGGQQAEGHLSPDQMARQVAAEGVSRIAVVSDDPDKYPAGTLWPPGTTLHHRDDLDAVQRELATASGVSLLLYDQTCATEKRRRRKRGAYPDPDKRIIVNELVCEGCGDCGVKSNCVSVQPLETEFGRKRQIDQSNCNKDFSCVKGFCPSFVTVHGARPKKAEPRTMDASALGAGELPEPRVPALDRNFAVVVTGVGGTGVVTIGAILGMAAHLEGKGCGMIDMAGLAQKGGAVFSHVRLAPTPEEIHAIRVAAGQADLVLGCDLTVTGSKKVLGAIRQGRSAVVVNTAESMPGDFTRNADFSLPTERLKRSIVSTAGRDNTHLVDATAAAVAFLGNAIAANMFMLGYAWQHGGVPLSRASLLRAIELNGEAVAMNRQAFELGRRAAHDPAALNAALAEAKAPTEARHISQSLDEILARRVEFLTSYQNAAYAARYRDLIEKVRVKEASVLPGQTALAEAVARYLFKLMAYKDEYEVARLYSDGAFRKQLAATFEKDSAAGQKLRLEFHLAPPLLAKRDPNTGLPRKMSFGPWMLGAFGLLAKLKGLRGTTFDIFGYTQERKTERKLIADYEALVAEILGKLSPQNHALCVALAAIPEKIRGFGHVKERHLTAAKAEEAELLKRLRDGSAEALAMPRAAE